MGKWEADCFSCYFSGIPGMMAVQINDVDSSADIVLENLRRLEKLVAKVDDNIPVSQPYATVPPETSKEALHALLLSSQQRTQRLEDALEVAMYQRDAMKYVVKYNRYAASISRTIPEEPQEHRQLMTRIEADMLQKCRNLHFIMNQADDQH